MSSGQRIIWPLIRPLPGEAAVSLLLWALTLLHGCFGLM